MSSALLRTVLAGAIDRLAVRLDCRKPWTVPSNRLDLARTIVAERLSCLAAHVDSPGAY